MKKLVILFVSIMFFQSCAGPGFFRQDRSYVSKDIVFLGGVGKAGIGGSDSGESWEDPIGGMIGVETKVVEITENSSLRSGVNISMQGADYSLTHTDEFDPDYPTSYSEYVTGTVATTYLNLPLLYNYTSAGGFYAEVGLQPGYLLRARDKIEGGEGYDYKDYMKGFELGLPLGVGYQINEQLSIGARAIWGLTNNSDSGSGDKDHNYLVVGTISYNIGSLLGKDK